jgi:hypothetical protein
MTENRKFKIEQKVAIAAIVIVISLSIFLYYSAVGDRSSHARDYEEYNYELYSPSELISIAASNNESLKNIIIQNYTSLGGIFNESGVSYFYIKINSESEETNGKNISNKNDSLIYEILIQNRTVISLNPIADLPPKLKKMQDNSFVEADQYLVSSKI